MELKFLDRGTKARFVLIDDDVQLGELEVVKNDDSTFAVHHTDIDPVVNQYAVGLAFVKEVVGYARVHSIKLLPICAIFKSIIDENPSMQDVLAI